MAKVYAGRDPEGRIILDAVSDHSKAQLRAVLTPDAARDLGERLVELSWETPEVSE